jgi:hydrogenase expression/formation protein HypC
VNDPGTRYKRGRRGVATVVPPPARGKMGEGVDERMTDSLHVFTGRITRVREEPTGREGRVSVGGAGAWVALDLVPDARVGDAVLVHAGVALALVRERDPVAASGIPLPLRGGGQVGGQ